MQLANAVFHESTFAGLEGYANNGYPHFRQTAPFLRLIRECWNRLNVKELSAATRLPDPTRETIYGNNSSAVIFLKDFSSFLSDWEELAKKTEKKKDSYKFSSTHQTFFSVRLASKEIHSLALYLINTWGFEFLLTRKF
uniref:Uncharacterized protein n=1 Tax=Lepeophtheirus salmonis TaxID=72036 RepID=A0A0K2TNQ2_LEPSM